MTAHIFQLRTEKGNLMSDTTTAPAAADAATQAALERLNTVIDRLIAPDGCP